MKYIRTKDGQIKSFDECYCDIGYIYQCINGIEIADTIDDLCDELIVVWKNWRYWHEHCFTFGEVEQIVEDFGLDDYEVYGAIWTDKGLIYVAKMNEKGELELL